MPSREHLQGRGVEGAEGSGRQWFPHPLRPKGLTGHRDAPRVAQACRGDTLLVGVRCPQHRHAPVERRDELPALLKELGDLLD